MKRFTKNVTLKNIGVITGGTAIGQILLLLSTPILTRLYTIEDFGIFQIFLSVFNFLYVISAGKFENAILLSKDRIVSSSLIVLSIVAASFIGIIVIVLNLVYKSTQYKIDILDKISSYIYLYPISILLSSLYLIFSSLAVKSKSFKHLGYTKISQSFFQIVIQLFFGYIVYKKAWGLIIGDIVGKVGGSFYLISRLKSMTYFSGVSAKSLRSTFTRFSDYPRYAAPAALVSAFGISIPFLMIGGFYGSATLGYLMLVHRVFAAPSALLGQSVSHVYMSSFSEAINIDNYQNALHLFNSYTLNLLKASILPFIIFAGVAPYAFEVIFGAQWHEAGNYARILTLGYLAGFIINPVSHTLNILKLSNWQLGWDIMRSTINFAGIFAIQFLKFDINYCIFFYSISLFITYISYYFLARIGISKKWKIAL